MWNCDNSLVNQKIFDWVVIAFKRPAIHPGLVRKAVGKFSNWVSHMGDTLSHVKFTRDWLVGNQKTTIFFVIF